MFSFPNCPTCDEAACRRPLTVVCMCGKTAVRWWGARLCLMCHGPFVVAVAIIAISSTSPSVEHKHTIRSLLSALPNCGPIKRCNDMVCVPRGGIHTMLSQIFIRICSTMYIQHDMATIYLLFLLSVTLLLLSYFSR